MSENLLEVRDLTITPAGAEAPVLDECVAEPGTQVRESGSSANQDRASH